MFLSLFLLGSDDILHVFLLFALIAKYLKDVTDWETINGTRKMTRVLFGDR